MSSMAPHLDLVPLLQKHDISWELFGKKGRPPAGTRDKRSAIVTELHAQGTAWSRMMEITGLSNGAIQRLTGAMWNENSKANRRANASRTGVLWRGKTRPGQLERQWESGCFDFLRGRTRSEDERQRLRDGWTKEVRKKHSAAQQQRWKDPAYREPLLAFHRSLEERAKRSKEQSRRMTEDPVKWTRGRGQYLSTKKCRNGSCLWVRSSYEVAAVHILEKDSSVVSYIYEHPFVLNDGKVVRPDFLLHRRTGEYELIEVKASWVFGLPADHKVSRRLDISMKIAEDHGWNFGIWTEKGVLRDALS